MKLAARVDFIEMTVVGNAVALKVKGRRALDVVEMLERTRNDDSGSGDEVGPDG